MSEVSETQTCKGTVEQIIEYKDGRKETRTFPNTVVTTGRAALAMCLANDVGDQFDFFINRMIFGNNGVIASGEPKVVRPERTGLFGPVVLSKPVIASIDYQTAPTQVVFTSVITFDEGNGFKLSEMAIQMYNSDLYSMVTFAELTKESTMQITWNWRITFV